MSKVNNTEKRLSIDNFVFEHDWIKKLKEESIESPELITSDLTEPEVIIPDITPSSQLDPFKIVDKDERKRPSNAKIFW